MKQLLTTNNLKHYLKNALLKLKIEKGCKPKEILSLTNKTDYNLKISSKTN